MKLAQKIRRIWHDLFYYKASNRKVEFGLTCNNVTENIDLKKVPNTVSDRFRMALHLSFCQACRNYKSISQALSSAIRSSPNPNESSIQNLNTRLLEKFSKKSHIDIKLEE